MGFGGLIAGALSGAAKGVGEVADIQIAQQQKIDYAKMLSDMQAEKELLIAGKKREWTNEDDQMRRDRDVADIGPTTAAKANAALAAAPTLGRATAAQTTAQMDAEDAANVPGRVRDRKTADVKAETKAKFDQEGESTKVLGADKTYLSALSALTNAKESSASKVQAALGQIQVDNARRVEALRKEFTSGATTPERKDAIREEIQLLTGKDNDSYMPVPIKDEMGNVSGYKVFDKKRGAFVEPGASGKPDASDPLGLRAGGASPAAGRPAGGAAAPVSTGPAVSGRPLYSMPKSELERRAARPRGVSTAEANEAQAELDARNANGGEARIGPSR